MSIELGILAAMILLAAAAAALWWRRGGRTLARLLDLREPGEDGCPCPFCTEERRRRAELAEREGSTGEQ